MTRFALLTFALFTSACAAEGEMNFDDATDEYRASLDDIDANSDRSTDRYQSLVHSTVQSYGKLMKKYGCSVEAVVYGAWSSKTRALRGQVLSLQGQPVSHLRGTIRKGHEGLGLIAGVTKSAQDTVMGDNFHSSHVFKGLVDGSTIEADFYSVGNGADYELFADWTTKGPNKHVRGVLANCD